MWEWYCYVAYGEDLDVLYGDVDVRFRGVSISAGSREKIGVSF